MVNSVMNSYQFDLQGAQLTLYRVHYPGSQTTHDQYDGFQAASDFTPRRINGLRNAVQYHLNWRCRIPSPFISTFSHRGHAENWAQVWRENNPYETCEIATIELGGEDRVMMFNVGDLVNRLGVATSLQPSQYRWEYLCFRNIPEEVIVDWEQV